MERGERDGLAIALAWVGAVGAVLTVGAVVTQGIRAGVSVGIGAGLAVSNLWVLGWIVRSIFGGGARGEGRGDEGERGEGERGEGERGGGGVGGIAVVKMFGLFFVVWVLLRLGVVEALPLVVGYGALPLGIVGAALSGSLRRP